jgi:hypothetical protein
MPVDAVEYKQFKGLLLPLDRKRMAEPYVVDGKNFIVDLDGPVSIFGRTWIDYQGIEEIRGFQTLECINSRQVFYCLEDCLAVYDVETRQLYPIYTHNVRVEFWPWSTASVGGVQYFANKEVGLLSRNPLTGLWTVVSGANIPPVVYGCCEAYGRLVLLGSESDGSVARASWSEIDDGSNAGFAPSTATGAGAQALSIIAGKLTPFLPLPYADGFIAYTNQGVCKFENVQAANPFRFRVLTRSENPLNPWVITRIGGQQRDQHVYLSHRGFYTTFGDEKPVVWEQLTSEGLHRNILPAIDHREGEFTTRVHYNDDSGWFTLSISPDSREHLYAYALVYYETAGEWGSFNKSHTGFGQVALNAGPFQGMHFGMCDTNGTIWRFSFTDSDRAYPVLPFFGIDYKEPADILAQLMATGTSIFNDQVIVTANDLSRITAPGVYDGAFEFAEGISPVPSVMPEELMDLSGTPLIFADALVIQAAIIDLIVLPLTQTELPLEATILIGPIKGQADKIDQISQFQELIISMLESGFQDEFEDYIEDYVDTEVIEDWLTMTGVEDWGESSGNNTEYSVRLIGTLDGYRTWIANNFTQAKVPALISQNGRNKHVAEVVSGMYLFVEISTNNIGETFHLKVLRANIANAGHLH